MHMPQTRWKSLWSGSSTLLLVALSLYKYKYILLQECREGHGLKHFPQRLLKFLIWHQRIYNNVARFWWDSLNLWTMLLMKTNNFFI